MASVEETKMINSFIDDCINAQNIYRMKHHAPPLTRNETLCNSAREWAQQLLTMSVLSNSPDANNGTIGENISRKRSPGSDCPDIGAQEVADQWYSENTKHDFRFGPPSDTPPVAGSFTQMVWKSTLEVGVWKVRTDGQCIVVAQYNPPGNVFGKYVENVEPVAAVDSEGTERRSNETMHYQGQDGSRYVLKRDTAEFVDHDGRYVRKVEEVRERVSMDSGTTPATLDKQLTDVVKAPPPLLPPEEYLKMEPEAIKALCGYEEEQLKEFEKKVLDTHNFFRRRHGTYPLKLNKELAGRAMKWAAHLCASARLSNSNEVHRGSPLGESIASRWSDNTGCDYDGKDLVEHWYSESSTYNFDMEPKSVEGIGNFTQVVWHSTRELGVAKFKRQDRSGCRVVVVCYYYPAGNVISFFKSNVVRPRPVSQATPDSKRTSASVQLNQADAYATSQQVNTMAFTDEPTSFAKSASPAPVFSPNFGSRSTDANGTKQTLGSSLDPRSPLIGRNPAIDSAFKQ